MTSPAPSLATQGHGERAGTRRAFAALLSGSFVGLGSLLTACATPAPEAGPAWTAGRLLLRVAATPERIAQSHSAAFELRGSGQQGELRLLSPLGTVLAEARWAPGVARLRTSDGEARYDSLDALARGALGEALPLAALPDWLAGRPWPEAASQALPTGFEQLGWTLDMTRHAQGWVEARRATAPELRLRVRLERAEP